MEHARFAVVPPHHRGVFLSAVWAWTWVRGILILGLASALALAMSDHTTADGTTTRVSLPNGGSGQGNGRSGIIGVALAPAGRYVAFTSEADNLVSGDTNGRADIFVHDRETLATTRVNLSSAGGEANDSGFKPALSADGRFVAFSTWASNLVPGDTNGRQDVFAHDRDADGDGVYDEPGATATVRVSVSSWGDEGNNSSEVGGQATAGSGRFVCFYSDATNLVPSDTNGHRDVFVHDRDADGNGAFDEPGGVKTVLVSVASNGDQSNGSSSDPAITTDGRFVAFNSIASNLVAGDGNGQSDVFVHDRDADGNGVFDEPGGIKTLRVSVSSLGSEGNGGSTACAMSPDGRYVTFASLASDLVPGDANGVEDVFLRDRDTDGDGSYDESGAVATVRVSVTGTGGQANGRSGGTSPVTANGRYVAFSSLATNLVSDDTNGVADVFVHDLSTLTTTRVSLGSGGSQGDGPSGGSYQGAGYTEPSIAISANGDAVAFRSDAANLVPDDTNDRTDVFLSARAPQPPTAISGLFALEAIPAEDRVEIRWGVRSREEYLGFYVLRSGTEGPFVRVSAMIPNSGESFPATLTWIDATAREGVDYAYRIEVVHPDGTPEEWRETVYAQVASRLPDRLTIRVLGPDPFRPDQGVALRIDSPVPIGDAVLRAFDPSGRHVATIFEGRLRSGSQVVRWDAPALDRLRSGRYLLKLEAGGQISTVQATLVR